MIGRPQNESSPALAGLHSGKDRNTVLPMGLNEPAQCVAAGFFAGASMPFFSR